ncbi:MAG: hypothetical protein KDD48_01255, partial [Bdellovibrionales bacterium]|nr:hypothetical protein [Bdellovibrionales bacterium]
SNMGANSGCSEWQTFWNQWASVSASAPGVQLIGGSTSSYSTSNDCTNPKIFLINTSASTLKITGNTYMCGMFIVASDTTIQMSGTVSLVGMILAMGTGSNIAYTGTSGTSNLVGKVIFKSNGSDSQKELYVKGNADVHFSSAGVGYALDAINNANAGGGSGGSGSLITSAWEETY